MVPFVRAFTNTLYREIVAVLGTQMGKTESCTNLMGHRLDDDPVPMLYIAPTKDFVEETFEPRFVDMIESSSLNGLMVRGHGERKTMKRVNGVKVRFGWAGSKASVAGEAACKVVVDELDLMEEDVVERAHERHATYADGQAVVTSTPSIGQIVSEQHPETGLFHWAFQDDQDALQSFVWSRWQEGTRHEWMWPCPDCGTYFAPRLETMWWPEESKAETIYQVFCVCPHCGVQVAEDMKNDLNASGVAVAPGQWVENGEVCGEPPATDVWSLWVSGLCSPWRSWLVAVRRLLRAREAGDKERERDVINTNFGECYSLIGEVPDWQEVANLRVPISPGAFPAEAVALTAGMDVQKNRLVYVVRAWGQDMESWGIEMDEIWGETEFDPVWSTASALLAKTWDGVPISAMFVDSGYRPGDKWKRPENSIYTFCRRHADRCWPTKGHDSLDKPIKPAKIDVAFGGQVIKNGLELWHVNSDYFKAWVQSRLTWPVDQPGAWHIHERATDEYCRQMVSEVRLAQHSRITWVKLRADNHYLDAESLAVAAAYKLNFQIQMPTLRVGPMQRQQGRRRVISRGIRR